MTRTEFVTNYLGLPDPMVTEWKIERLRRQAEMLKELEPHKIRMFTDASHGWLEVSLLQAINLGLCAKDFSNFSYTNGEYQGREFVWSIWSQCPLNGSLKPIHCYYLEEDNDAVIYLRRHQLVYECQPEITHIELEANCEIRRLPAIY
jgi:hypothetical protein